MANNVKFELNREGVKELMQSKEMMAVCRQYADAAMSSLGSGYEVSEMVGKTRVNVQIEAATFRARQENLQNNTILKSLPRGL